VKDIDSFGKNIHPDELDDRRHYELLTDAQYDALYRKIMLLLEIQGETEQHIISKSFGLDGEGRLSCEELSTVLGSSAQKIGMMKAASLRRILQALSGWKRSSPAPQYSSGGMP
jgi:DNA-directed RNA polymerase sigma subunit (sigma70/sigma32)